MNGTLAEGSEHTCAILNRGVWCWGSNDYGQLGNNAASISHLLIPVQGLGGGAQSVVAAKDYTCAVVNGGAWCWGYDEYGELGDPSVTKVSSMVPVPVEGLGSGVQALAAGDEHVCALVNGGVQCWGADVNGQLGNGTTSDGGNPVPVAVQGLGSPGSGVQAITASADHTCALVNGGLQCWGGNNWGQLASPIDAGHSSVPLAVPGLDNGVQAVGAGFSHTCALVNGGVQCWGTDITGQLGNGVFTDAGDPVPTSVVGLGDPASGVQSLAAGYSTTCSLVNGGIQCWGSNSTGQLGNNSTAIFFTVPVAVLGIQGGVQAIAAGANHVCAVVNGGVQCWGNNGVGQLGNASPGQSSVPTAVQGLDGGVVAIVAGKQHTCAVVSGGALCWGDNEEGQLGSALDGGSSLPMQVQSLGPSSGVQGLAAGYHHTCALVNGGAQCWGNNVSGDLGNGAEVESSAPVQVQGLQIGVQALAAGADFTCALVGGGAQCWGSNATGQLGNSSTTDSPVPVGVQGLGSNVQAVTAGFSHACALVGGGAMCWGDNTYGQLGNGSDAGSTVPVPVPGLSAGVQALAAGDDFTCALVNGGIMCWGDNGAGQLGNGSDAGSSVPVGVSGLGSNVLALAAGLYHACALATSGVQCWGDNSDGELGNGGTNQSWVPIPVSAWAP